MVKDILAYYIYLSLSACLSQNLVTFYVDSQACLKSIQVSNPLGFAKSFSDFELFLVYALLVTHSLYLCN